MNKKTTLEERREPVTGDEFLIGDAHCRYVGRVPGYADGTGPLIDIIAIPSIILPSAKMLTFAYQPGTWEHRRMPLKSALEKSQAR